jgi:hypothetical protein
VTLRARWVTLRACWVTLRARWVTLRARWVTRRARWVTLRARLLLASHTHRCMRQGGRVQARAGRVGDGGGSRGPQAHHHHQDGAHPDPRPAELRRRRREQQARRAAQVRCSDDTVANRDSGMISGGRSLTGSLRDAGRVSSTRWHPVQRATRTALGFGICTSFKDHSLSRRVKP